MKDMKQIMTLVLTEKKYIVFAVLFGFFAAVSSIGLMGMSGYLISRAALHPPLYALTLSIIAVRFFGLARAGTRYVERYVSHHATFSILGRIRVFFYDKLEPLAPAVFMNYRSGDLLSRIMADVERLQFFFLRVLYPPFVTLLVFLATGYLLSFFSWAATGALLAGLLVTAGIIPAVITYFARDNGLHLRQERARISVQATEFLLGFVDLKVNGQIDHRKAMMEQTSAVLIKEQQRNGLLAAAGESAALLGAFFTTWVVLICGIFAVVDGQIDGVFLAVMVLVTLTAFESATPVAAIPAHLEESRVAAKRLFRISDEQNERQNIIVPQSEPYLQTDAQLDLLFHDVTFAYPNGGRQVLQNIELHIPAGSKVAVVGSSGSGKSSLLHILLKFYESYQGDVVLEGRNLAEYTPEEARRYFGVVLQENHFFHASVRANLLLAKPEASDTELLDLLRQMELEHLALDDILSDRGMSLSGGERQRLAIARMILKNAPIWLLDEPGTGLDALTEQAIFSKLESLASEKTVLYITHRLVGLEHMDAILVMDKGRIIEQGTYEELLQRQGYFYQLRQLEMERL